MSYLVAAYVVLWVVHLAYLWSLSSRQRRLHEEIQQLEARTAPRAPGESPAGRSLSP